jgi:hypothetical protein
VNKVGCDGPLAYRNLQGHKRVVITLLYSNLHWPAMIHSVSHE